MKQEIWLRKHMKDNIFWLLNVHQIILPVCLFLTITFFAKINHILIQTTVIFPKTPWQLDVVAHMKTVTKELHHILGLLHATCSVEDPVTGRPKVDRFLLLRLLLIKFQ